MPEDRSSFAPHFSFAELTDSANHPGLVVKNRSEAQPYLAHGIALSWLAEDIRTVFGVPWKVHSGFRGDTLNTAVGSTSKTSQHKAFQALDAHPIGVDLRNAFDRLIRIDAIMARVGQIILEGRGSTPTWIHVSLGEGYWPHPERYGEIAESFGGRFKLIRRWEKKP